MSVNKDSRVSRRSRSAASNAKPFVTSLYCIRLINRLVQHPRRNAIYLEDFYFISKPIEMGSTLSAVMINNYSTVNPEMVDICVYFNKNGILYVKCGHCGESDSCVCEHAYSLCEYRIKKSNEVIYMPEFRKCLENFMDKQIAVSAVRMLCVTMNMDMPQQKSLTIPDITKILCDVADSSIKKTEKKLQSNLELICRPASNKPKLWEKAFEKNIKEITFHIERIKITGHWVSMDLNMADIIKRNCFMSDYCMYVLHNKLLDLCKVGKFDSVQFMCFRLIDGYLEEFLKNPKLYKNSALPFMVRWYMNLLVKIVIDYRLSLNLKATIQCTMDKFFVKYKDIKKDKCFMLDQWTGEISPELMSGKPRKTQTKFNLFNELRYACKLEPCPVQLIKEFCKIYDTDVYSSAIHSDAVEPVWLTQFRLRHALYDLVERWYIDGRPTTLPHLPMVKFSYESLFTTTSEICRALNPFSVLSNFSNLQAIEGLNARKLFPGTKFILETSLNRKLVDIRLDKCKIVYVYNLLCLTNTIIHKHKNETEKIPENSAMFMTLISICLICLEHGTLVYFKDDFNLTYIKRRHWSIMQTNIYNFLKECSSSETMISTCFTQVVYPVQLSLNVHMFKNAILPWDLLHSLLFFRWSPHSNSVYNDFSGDFSGDSSGEDDVIVEGSGEKYVNFMEIFTHHSDPTECVVDEEEEVINANNAKFPAFPGGRWGRYHQSVMTCLQVALTQPGNPFINCKYLYDMKKNNLCLAHFINEEQVISWEPYISYMRVAMAYICMTKEHAFYGVKFYKFTENFVTFEPLGKQDIHYERMIQLITWFCDPLVVLNPCLLMDDRKLMTDDWNIKKADNEMLLRMGLCKLHIHMSLFELKKKIIYVDDEPLKVTRMHFRLFGIMKSLGANCLPLLVDNKNQCLPGNMICNLLKLVMHEKFEVHAKQAWQTLKGIVYDVFKSSYHLNCSSIVDNLIPLFMDYSSEGRVYYMEIMESIIKYKLDFNQLIKLNAKIKIVRGSGNNALWVNEKRGQMCARMFRKLQTENSILISNRHVLRPYIFEALHYAVYETQQFPEFTHDFIFEMLKCQSAFVLKTTMEVCLLKTGIDSSEYNLYHDFKEKYFKKIAYVLIHDYIRQIKCENEINHPNIKQIIDCLLIEEKFIVNHLDGHFLICFYDALKVAINLTNESSEINKAIYQKFLRDVEI